MERSALWIELAGEFRDLSSMSASNSAAFWQLLRLESRAIRTLRAELIANRLPCLAVDFDQLRPPAEGVVNPEAETLRWAKQWETIVFNGQISYWYGEQTFESQDLGTLIQSSEDELLFEIGPEIWQEMAREGARFCLWIARCLASPVEPNPVSSPADSRRPNVDDQLPENGPLGVDSFVLDGVTLERLSRTQMRFLEAVLKAPGQAVDTRDLVGPGNVWEDELGADKDAVGGLRRRINDVFREFGVGEARRLASR